MGRRVLLVTSGLGVGGAERQLAALLACSGDEMDAGVVSLTPPGPVSSEIEALGVPVWHLHLRRPSELVAVAWRLRTIVRWFGPHVVQGWMYHGNLAALLAARTGARVAPVVWAIRQSLYDLSREKRGTRVVIQLGARLSGRAAAIVYNASVSREQHEAIGFSRGRGRVIGNGFDGERWRPDGTARRSVREELGIASDAPLIGLVARYHPMKGHEVFLEAAARLVMIRPDVHFLLAGSGVVPDNPIFERHSSSGPLARHLHLLGERRDVPRLTAALDVSTSTSLWGEGFSNAIAEALCCGVPVVATDVGEARAIVGDAGRIVPPGDAGALALAWLDLLEQGVEARQAMGESGRRRLLARHSVDAMAKAYQTLYAEVLEECRRA